MFAKLCKTVKNKSRQAEAKDTEHDGEGSI